MKLATLRRKGDAVDGVVGVARLDRRTKRLVTRLNPGDIAVIDHADLDRVAADTLVAARPAAVVNAAPSISGRYPNLGPERLVENGILLLDNVGEGIFKAVKEGTRIRIDGDTVYVGDEPVASGAVQDVDTVAQLMVEAKAGLSSQLEAFAANTIEYMRRERALLLDGVGVPDIRTRIEGRHVLIVVRGYDYEADLAALRNYIREFKPILIGVDGGADALRDAGHKPHLIVGDMDSVSDDVLASGAEVIVHAFPDGRAPGLARVQDLGITAVTFPTIGTSEDIAMLLADEKGAEPGRRRRYPQRPGRVPRQGPRRRRLHLPHPAQTGRQAHRREGREPALPQPDLVVVDGRTRPRGVHRDRCRPRDLHRRPDVPRRPGSDMEPFHRLDTGSVLVISFRYHVVSLVAVFLALALGIVVGTTALNGPITDDLRKRVDAANSNRDQLASQLQSAKSQNSDADAFVSQFGSLVVKDTLKGQKVLVLDLPDASSTVDSDVTTEIAAAGATVSGKVKMSADFFSTARAADIKTLVTNGTQPTAFTIPSSDDAVTLGSALLAFVLTGKGSTTDLSKTMSSFSTLQMLQVAGSDQIAAATLVVVVGTGATTDKTLSTGESTFASSFQQAGATVVVAGDAASDTGLGLVATIRNNGTLSRTISTVDNATAAMGQISTVLALSSKAQVGGYGTGDKADSPYPKLTS